MRPGVAGARTGLGRGGLRTDALDHPHYVAPSGGSVLVVSGDTFLQVQYLSGGFGSGDEDAALAAELAGKVVANLGG